MTHYTTITKGASWQHIVDAGVLPRKTMVSHKIDTKRCTNVSQFTTSVSNGLSLGLKMCMLHNRCTILMCTRKADAVFNKKMGIDTDRKLPIIRGGAGSIVNGVR